MKVLIYGLGLNGGGYSAAKFFLEHSHEVLITDIKNDTNFKKSISELSKLGARFHLGHHFIEDFQWADLVVKNPSIPPNNKYLKYAKKITTDFVYLIENYNLNKIKIIGITGTKGKTTTSHAIYHVLNKLNYKAEMAGNMGISAFEIANKLERKENKIDYLICEFSSWQLRDISLYLNKDYPTTHLAIFTNLLEDHQNSYNSMERYLQDKLKLFTLKTKNVLCPVNFCTAIQTKTHLNKKNIFELDNKVNNSIKDKPELIPAFKALKILKIKQKQILTHLSSFSGVSHRIEWVGNYNDIYFINDSAATIPAAVNFSFSHFRDVNIHIITGGTDKELHVSPMISLLNKASSITLLDGSFTQNKLIPYLKDNKIKFYGPYKQMKSAVKKAFNEANSDNSTFLKIILLSPGASSFEYFINEFDRGNQFKKSAKYFIDKD